MTKYPEHEKLMKVKTESQTIGEFLEWLLHTKRVHSERFKHDGLEIESPVMLAIYRPVLDSDPAIVPWYFGGIEKLLADYYTVDLKEIEKEKRQMLDDIRGDIKAMNAK